MCEQVDYWKNKYFEGNASVLNRSRLNTSHAGAHGETQGVARVDVTDLISKLE